MIRVERSPEYFADLTRIDDFFSIEMESPKAALKMIRGIENTVGYLDERPELGKSYEYNGMKTPYRFLVFERFIIFYVVRKETVVVARVFDTRMEYISELFPGMK